MNAPYFIEVLARNHEVRHRLALQNLPIRIGRAYDNDVILDDPHMAPHHAEIDVDAEGRMLVRDLGTHNGVIIGRKRQTSATLDGYSIFRIGHTRLRVRSADFQVAPEIADTTNHQWEGWPPAVVGLAMVILVTLINTWLGSTEKFSAIPYLQSLTTYLVASVIWCGLWAFATHTLAGHARFGRHLFVVGSALLIAALWEAFSSVLAYAFSLENLVRIHQYVLLGIGAAALGFHQFTINPRHPKRFALFAGIAFALGAGSMMLTYFQIYGRYTDELYMHTLLPPSLRLSPNHPTEEFFGHAKQLKAKADSDREAPTTGSLGEDADE